MPLCVMTHPEMGSWRSCGNDVQVPDFASFWSANHGKPIVSADGRLGLFELSWGRPAATRLGTVSR